MPPYCVCEVVVDRVPKQTPAQTLAHLRLVWFAPHRPRLRLDVLGKGSGVMRHVASGNK